MRPWVQSPALQKRWKKEKQMRWGDWNLLSTSRKRKLLGPVKLTVLNLTVLKNVYFIYLFIVLCLCVYEWVSESYVHMGGHAMASMWGHLAGVGSLSLPCKSQELTQIFKMAFMSGDEPHTTLVYLYVTLLFLWIP